MLLVCAVALCICLLCSCGSQLTGKWTSAAGSGVQLTLSTSGKAALSSGDVELTGTYTVEGNTLTLSLASPLGDSYVIEAQFTVEDGRLMLTNEKGYTETFIK